MDITAHASVAEFFHGVLAEAMSHQAVSASEPTELYLVALLGEFAHARITDEPLSLKLAGTAEPGERVRALKEVGDTTLYMTGFFAQSLRRGLVAADYYIGLGEAAYRELAGRMSGSSVQAVYQELAAKFPRFVDVLAEVSLTFQFAGADVVRLYEQWLASRDEWVERRLRGLGVLVSAPSAGGKVILQSVLGRLQRGLERLYRIEIGLEVDDFVIDADQRARLGPGRLPREQLLLAEDEGALSLGLFVDRDSLANLAANDPAHRLDDDNLQDFLFAVEGVSHFVYLAWRAQADRPVSALELELQGEVDKYVTCVLTHDGSHQRADDLHRRLFEDFELEPDLDGEERDRYREANAQAGRYSESLARRFLRPHRILDMLAELRRFYRLPLAGKVDLIRSAA